MPIYYYIIAPLMIFSGIGANMALPPPSHPVFASYSLIVFLTFLASYILLIAWERNKMLTMSQIRALSAIRVSILLALFFSLGYMASVYRVSSCYSPLLQEKIGPAKIIGTIFKIEPREKDSRLYIKDIKIYAKPKPKSDLPKIIRINTKDKERDKLKLGMVISTRVELIPMPPPTHSEGFDLTRSGYFNKIGAIGYSVGKVYIKSYASKPEFHERVNLFINSLRRSIASRIKEIIKEPYHGIASAILVGETSEIPQKEASYLRKSGTAHLIAISGMHIVSVAGVVFFLVKLIGRNTRISASIDITKLAAAISILCMICYLLIAGAPVSAQRAVAMSTIFFIGSIINRDYDPLKTISIVASSIALYRPELIFSPGLQMSFAASGSLIATFKSISRYLPEKQNSFMKNLFINISMLLISSLAASLATAPFIAYHFNQVSLYSILANLFCVPLTEVFVMPFGLLSLVLMPISLEAVGLIPMKAGIYFLVKVSKFIADIPYSTIHVSQVTDLSIILISISLFFSIFLQKKIMKFSALAFFFIFGSFSILNKKEIPAIIISGERKLFAVRSDIICGASIDSMFLIPSSKQKSRYSYLTWRQFFGEDNFSSKPLRLFNIKKCNHNACELCFKGDISGKIDINNEEVLTIFDKKSEPILSISKCNLESFGTHTIYASYDKGNVYFKVKKVINNMQRDKPWHFRFFKAKAETDTEKILT